MKYDEVELEVTHHVWHWPMSARRLGNRRRVEGDIAIRWLRRFVARRAATVTRDPVLSIPDGCLDHWLEYPKCLVLSAYVILGGRRFGLPERFQTVARTVVIPVPEQRPRAVTTSVTVRPSRRRRLVG